MQTPAHVVVLGAGFAGLAAVKALRRARNVRVTLVDRTNHHLFQPLLYQVASAALNPSEIAAATRAVLRGQKNTRVLMGEVTHVDYEQRTVDLDGGQTRLCYDYLILAMGGRTSYFGQDQWQQHAPGLKSLDDAIEIRTRLLAAFERAEKAQDPEDRQRLMTFVVVGGGPTVVELAGAFAELRRHVLRWDFRGIDPASARIVLIEAADSLLGPFPERLRQDAARRLQKLGVDVRLKEKVLSIRPGVVETSTGPIPTETCIWAAGVGGHELAADLGPNRDRAGRLVVEEDLRLPDQDRVWCLGDMAHYEHPHTLDGRTLPGVAPVAVQQGRHAARDILRLLKGESTRPFHYQDKGSMATIGRSAAVAFVGPVQMTGPLAWLAWLFVHLMYLVDFQLRVLVLIRWTWAYFTWKWGVRLITRPLQERHCPLPGLPDPPEGR